MKRLFSLCLVFLCFDAGCMTEQQKREIIENRDAEMMQRGTNPQGPTALGALVGALGQGLSHGR
jgi:hypothetical protein